MSLPDFICIGAQKAGTTWLYHMLKQNPSIWLPPVKEIHYFDSGRLLPSRKIDKKEIYIKQYKRTANLLKRTKLDEYKIDLEYYASLITDDILTQAWYRRVFEHPHRVGRVAGEITPAYLDMNKNQVLRATTLLSEAKFIALIRDPLYRLASQTRMLAKTLRTKNLTDQDWRLILEKLERNPRGRYQDSIALWNKSAGEARMLYLPFAMIKKDPKTVLAKVESFIGAEPFDDYAAVDERKNVSVELEIPDWLMAKLIEQAEPAKAFIINQFGQEFYDLTK